MRAPPTTPWYYGWNVIAVGIAFQTIIFGVSFFSYTLWAGQWRTAFHAARGDVMLGIMILTVCQGVMAPLAGRAMDRMSIRALICAGAVITAGGFVLISQATALWQILAIYGTIVALGTLLAGPLAAQTLAAKWFSRRRGLAIGFSTIGTSLGGFLLPPVVAWLFLSYGWREAHLILAGVIVVTVVPMIWLVVRNSPEEAGVPPEPESHAAARQPAQAHPDWTTGMLLRQRNFWITIGAFVPMATVFGALQHNLAQIASDSGIDAARASWVVVTLSGAMVLGKIGFGAVADRYDLRLLFTGAIGLLACSGLIFMTTPAFPLLCLGAAVMGVAQGGFLPLLGCIVGTRFGPHAFGRVMGLVGLFTPICAAGPWLAGRLRDIDGSYDLVIQIFLALLVPALVAIFFLKPLVSAIEPARLVPGE
ncbi:MAG: MFS transporter [Alphaproteobacteria bacterium]|nr:MFS transporter [Alphaproteobacteria bacterium]